MITVERSPSKLHWQVMFNGRVISPGHATKAQAEGVARPLRLQYKGLLC